MRADFGRNALEASGRIERRAGAFVHAAAVPNVAAFAFLLVAFHKGAYLVAGGLVKAGKHIPLQVWRALPGGDEPRTREDVPVRRDADVAVVHVAGVLPEPFPKKQ